jgi:hypothetical protein
MYFLLSACSLLCSNQHIMTSTEFDDIVVTEAELVAAIEASPTKTSNQDVHDMAETTSNDSTRVVEAASQMPSGHPQQAVEELGQRLTSLSDALKIAKAKERSRRRHEVTTQLQSTIRQLNILYKQNFKVGDRVLVKHKCRRTCVTVQHLAVVRLYLLGYFLVLILSPPPLSADQVIHHFQRQ